MEPTDEQKHEIIRALQHQLGKLSKNLKPPKELLGEYPIPTEYIERVLLLASTDADSRKGTNGLWRYIHSIMPATADYRCSLDVSNATRPAVKLREYQPDAFIRVGVDGVLECHALPAENYAEVEQLTYVDDAKSTVLTRYKLWSRLEQLLPPIAGLEHSNAWKLFVGPDDIVVFRCEASHDADADSGESDDN